MDQQTLRAHEYVDAAPAPFQPLKIGVLSYRSAPHVGGQGIFLEYLTRALADYGHEVTVISGPPYPDLDPRVGLVELPSLDLYNEPHNGHFALRPKHLLSATDTYEYFGHLSGKFVEPYTFGQRVYKHLSEHSGAYDVLLDNQSLSKGILDASNDFGIPLVTFIHHPITRDRRLDLAAEKSFRRRLLIRRWFAFHHMQVKVAKASQFILTPSENSKQHIAEEFGVDPERMTIIRVGVDRRHFKPKPNLERVPNRIVTTASADVAMKGLVYLVEAYADLLKRHDDLELLIIGKLRNGPTSDLIDRLGLRDRIKFKHGLTREELAQEFCKATMLVSPSLYEGYGLPAAEAMSCGTPVISTDGGALPEVVGDAGIVVPKADSQALSNAIASLLDNPSERARVAAACLARAEDLFDWQNIIPTYDDVLRQAIAAQC